MNAATVLLAPWRATTPSVRWFLRIGMALAAAITLVIGMWLGPHWEHWDLTAGGILAFAGFFAGMFLLAPTLLLATDARQLRLPGMQRDAVLGALTWTVTLVALPTGMIALAGGHAVVVACLLAMALLGGVTLALLPAYVAAMVGLLPMAITTLAPHADLPGPGEPGFVPLAATAMGVSLALCVLCWRRQLRSDDPYRQAWTQPMVLQFRRIGRGGWGGLSCGLPDAGQQIRQQPEWMRPSIALGPSGPQQPRYSLRVALGGMFAPLTPLGRVRQLAVSLLPSVLVVALLSLQAARRHGGLDHAAAWVSHEGALLGWFIAFVGLLATLLSAMQLGQRWQRHNGELPLLALLPGLGSPAQARRALLQASLLPGVGLQLGAMALVAALALGLHMDAVAAGSLLLTQLGGIVLLVAFTFMVLGGRPLSGWGGGALVVASFVLVGTSLFVSMLGREATRLAGGDVLAALLAGWIVLLAVLCWLGGRGWRGLHRRPHAFMVNG